MTAQRMRESRLKKKKKKVLKRRDARSKKQ